MPRRNLLLCFDAFGTLFSPKPSVAEQYTAIAHQCGLTGFTTSQVQSSLGKAISNQLRIHPNYGKASGMGAEKWWTNVINDTFLPLTNTTSLPASLAPSLLRRFESSEGYAIADPDLPSILSQLKNRPHSPFNSIIIGVITNSDDRVPGILSSLGFNVSPLRFGSPPPADAPNTKEYQIDFHCMSYDVGVGKPSKHIFASAELMAEGVLSSHLKEKPNGESKETTPWLKVCVGDEFEKDVVGSTNAGWNSVLVGPSEEAGDLKELGLMRELDDVMGSSVDEVFTQSNDVGSRLVSVRADTIGAFLRWLNR
ncbi:haloacid dehalogenase [Immersiella caudata]|uniref:Haloacid dehalogenase n=1 Tax=Immersiella caudata TaxID=314043 RepID=A0AA39WFT0_9PEZI|nr:haloacid dehalogenase [Immersiella caudata]